MGIDKSRALEQEELPLLSPHHSAGHRDISLASSVVRLRCAQAMHAQMSLQIDGVSWRRTQLCSRKNALIGCKLMEPFFCHFC